MCPWSHYQRRGFSLLFQKRDGVLVKDTNTSPPRLAVVGGKNRQGRRAPSGALRRAAIRKCKVRKERKLSLVPQSTQPECFTINAELLFFVRA
jgi:hypothetical protein